MISKVNQRLKYRKKTNTGLKIYQTKDACLLFSGIYLNFKTSFKFNKTN
jgi:hypothetical protein